MEGDVHRGFWWGTSEGNNDLENLDIDEKIKMDLKKIGWGGGGGVDWIDLPHGTDKWRAFMSAVMNLRAP